MSSDLMYDLITKMNIKLNQLIVDNNYNLLCEEVQNYSRRLDKVLTHYNKVAGRKMCYSSQPVQLREMKKYLVK